MIITENDISTIEKLIKIPTILFSDHETIYLNKTSRELDLSSDHLYCKAVDYVDLKEFKCQIMVEKRSGGSICMRMDGEWVTYQGKPYIFAQFYDISYSRELMSKISRLSKARGLMLDISLSSAKITEIDSIYDMILKNVMYTIEKSSLATIFRLVDGVFQVVAKSGYAEEAKDFRIPVEESFLYLATGGKMDKTTVIEDLSQYRENYHPIKIEKNESVEIQSTLIAPLFVDHEIFGMICVDSAEKNAFSDEDLEIMQFVKNSIEVTLSNRWYLDKIDYLANHDPLTGLMNRTGLISYLKQTMHTWKENQVFIVIFDVNHLKYTNDNYGHLWGDRVICDISKSLSELCEQDGILTRFGGDEFLGVFFEQDLDTMIVKIEEVKQKLSEHTYKIQEEQAQISFSYGVACFGKDTKELHHLIAVADQHMYEDKKKQRM